MDRWYARQGGEAVVEPRERLQAGASEALVDKMHAAAASRHRERDAGEDEGEGAFMGAPAPPESERLLERLRSAAVSESGLAARAAATFQLGKVPSHRLVQFDAQGFASRDRFVFVDEVDCIGCMHCANTARNTFFIEESYGRARSFLQDGDPEALVEEAIDTCPVNCIYYTNYEDLVALESERDTTRELINNQSRLVGGDLARMKGQKMESLSKSMRCENCPTRGCYECPLYGVGNNPEYQRQAALRAQRDAEHARRLLADGG